jgi:excisionase family DNA binding protein
VRWVDSEAPGQGPANVRLVNIHQRTTHRPGATPYRMHRRTPACVERSMASDPDRRSVVPPNGGTTARTGESALPQPTESRYLRTAQVAELLHVSPKTVSRWAQEGRLPFFRTLGGHRRYPDAEIRALLETLSELSPVG